MPNMLIIFNWSVSIHRYPVVSLVWGKVVIFVNCIWFFILFHSELFRDELNGSMAWNQRYTGNAKFTCSW